MFLRLRLVLRVARECGVEVYSILPRSDWREWEAAIEAAVSCEYVRDNKMPAHCLLTHKRCAVCPEECGRQGGGSVQRYTKSLDRATLISSTGSNCSERLPVAVKLALKLPYLPLPSKSIYIYPLTVAPESTDTNEAMKKIAIRRVERYWLFLPLMALAVAP